MRGLFVCVHTTHSLNSDCSILSYFTIFPPFITHKLLKRTAMTTMCNIQTPISYSFIRRFWHQLVAFFHLIGRQKYTATRRIQSFVMYHTHYTARY